MKNQTLKNRITFYLKTNTIPERNNKTCCLLCSKIERSEDGVKRTEERRNANHEYRTDERNARDGERCEEREKRKRRRVKDADGLQQEALRMQEKP